MAAGDIGFLVKREGKDAISRLLNSGRSIFYFFKIQFISHLFNPFVCFVCFPLLPCVLFMSSNIFG